MIFVTVGTHEQPFDRLVRYMDIWAGKHKEKVIIQTGYSKYEPKYCKWEKMFPYNEMTENINNARIVITHGGASSFIIPLHNRKIPIVVPRRKEFHEHINNHQVVFCRQFSERQKNIIVVDDINSLGETINQYENILPNIKKDFLSNNEIFCKNFNKIIDELF